HPRRAALRHSQGWFRRQYRHTFGTADDPGHAAPAGGGDTAADTLHHGPGGTADLPRALESAQPAHHSAGGAGRHGAGLGGLSLDERGAYPADDRYYRAGLHSEYLAASGRAADPWSEPLARRLLGYHRRFYQLQHPRGRAADQRLPAAAEAGQDPVDGHHRGLLRRGQLRQDSLLHPVGV